MPSPPSLRLFACVSIGIASWSCAPPETGGAGPARASEAPAPVELVAAREESFESVLRVTGELVAREEVGLAAKVRGRLASVEADLGSRVRAGELLAQIERREYELALERAAAALEVARAQLGLRPDQDDALLPEETARVREARAELDAARIEHERLAQLLREGAVTRSTFDSAEARRAVAESRWVSSLEEVESLRALVAQRRSELELARHQLAETELRAPFDGAVAERAASPGAFVEAGEVVLRLVAFHPLRVRLAVPERRSAELRQGQLVRVHFEGGQASREARLVRLGAALASTSRALTVEAELDNEDGALRPGSFVRAEIAVDPEARALVIPRSALRRFAGIDRVLVVEEGRVVERGVRVGRLDEQRVEILSGLAAGEELVLAPGGLRAGAAVQVSR